MDLIGIRDTQKDGVALEEIFNFETGSLASESNQEGDYTFITASEEFKTHAKFTHNCKALIYAVGASGSLGRCHYFNGKFIASNLCLILTPKDKNKVEMKFYAKYLNAIGFLKRNLSKFQVNFTKSLLIGLLNLCENQWFLEIEAYFFMI